MKEEWSNFIRYLEPCLQSLLSKTIEVYDASKNSLMPHLVKACTLTDPYIEVVASRSNIFCTFNSMAFLMANYVSLKGGEKVF